MKKYIVLSLLLISCFSHYVKADRVYIVGTYDTLSIEDFQQQGSLYTAYIDVMGDDGQELIFDIDAKVGGEGDLSVKDRCCPPHVRNCTPCPLYELTYTIEIQVSCSNHAVGSDMDGTYSFSNRYPDIYQEVQLLVDNSFSTGGQCRQLRIDVDQIDAGELTMIDVDILIAEPF